MDDKHTGDWDAYWRGTHENAAHREGGPQEEVLARFWAELFSSEAGQAISMLDLACGNGAVTGHAIGTGISAAKHCVDFSQSALLELQKRYPETLCAVADAGRLPWKDGQFGLVVSQFGVEYAGGEALLEAGRVVAPGGCLAAILHLEGGGIYRECDHNRQVVEAMNGLSLLTLAHSAFTAGYALNRGEVTVEKFKSAERAFTPAVRGLEDILRRYGSNSADGLPQQLYSDIASMYQRMSAFEESDVLDWIDGMEKELAAYLGRMQSMIEAALGQSELHSLMGLLAQRGFEQSSPRVLHMGPASEPAAWAIVLRREG